MAPTVGYAVLPIIPSLKGAQATIQRELAGIGPQAGQRVGDQIGRGMDSSLRGHVQRLSATISTGLLAAGAAGGAAAVGIGKLGIELASQQEQAEVSFTAIMGSAERAQGMLGDLADFAAKTPFDLPGLQKSASQLLAVGVNADRVIPLMETLGDATAGMGTGAEGIAQAVRALTQMEQKGKVTAEEMLQLAEAGVPAWEALAVTMGVSVAQAQDKVTKGGVQVEQVFQALEDKAGPTLQRLTGLMDEQSKTLDGLWSSWKDQAGQDLARAFEPTVGELKEMLPLLSDATSELLDRFAPGVASIAGTIGDWLPSMVDGLGSGLDLLEEYGPALAGISGVILGMGKTSLPFVGDLIPGGPLALGIAGLVASTPEARDALADLAAEVGPLGAEFGRELLPILGDLQDMAADVLPPAIGLTGDALKVVFAVATPLAGAVGDLTGLLADHSEVVLVAAGAWAAFKIQAAGAALWSGMAAGASTVTALTSSMVGLRSAIQGIAATRGVSELAATMGVLRSTMTANVSAGTAFGGALAGIAVGAGVASFALDKLHESGSRDASEWLAGLGDADLSTIDSSLDRITTIQARIQTLTDEMNSGPSNRFDDEHLAAEILALEREFDSLQPAVLAATRALGDWSRETGLNSSQIEALIKSAGIDLPDAFDAAGKPSAELQRAFASMSESAETLNVDLNSIEMSPEQIKQMEEDAKRVQKAIESAAEGASAAVMGFGDLLSLKDEPVDPKQLAAAEEAVQRAREQVAEAERAASAGGQTADEAERTASALADARDNLVSANRSLQDLRASDSPLNASKIEAFYADQLEAVREFQANIRTAIEAGYDPQLISRIIQAGPAEAGPILEQLVANSTGAFVEMVNAAEAELGELSMQAAEMARLTEMAVQNHSESGQQMVKDLATAQAISLAQLKSDGTETIEELARIAGVSVAEFKRVAGEFKLGLGDIKSEVDEILGALTVSTGWSMGQITGGGRLPGRASGGAVEAGWTGWVGEQGPEILTIPAAGYVFDHAESMRMLAGAKEAAKQPQAAPQPPATSTWTIKTAASETDVRRVIQNEMR